ncbi:ras GTPase-activating-like protein [Ordospora pajunii]|uniref:ras GTPase-activating-like protein n=1 Tax=Ordospora pajunii TaxID=3039483 RepID=UPI00295261AA|nr:ras GTPase-activating-like protein [Ordospora pajunii]KAH9411372.1 ras GTPase-activating-like protein [Ordospora pajunii]
MELKAMNGVHDGLEVCLHKCHRFFSPMENRKEELKRNSINVHQRLGTDAHVTSEEMDAERRNTKAYEYLCRLEEAKTWIGEFANVPEAFEEFEDEMKRGMVLAEVCRAFAPRCVKSVFNGSVLQYRHTDNINYFLDGIVQMGLPRHFHFEVIDLYEGKNFAKVIYCIHALAHFLSSKGISRSIRSAKGKVFSEDDMARADVQVENMLMPKFDEIGKRLWENLKREEMMEQEGSETAAESDEEKCDGTIGENECSFFSEDMSMCGESVDILKLTLKTFLYKKCFDDIYYRKDASLFSIRRFVFLFFSNSSEMVKENQIENLHYKISKVFDSIYEKEAQIKDIEMRMRLMIQNRMEVGNIIVKSPMSDDADTKVFEKVLMLLRNNPKYLSGLLMHVSDLDAFVVSIVIPIFSNVCSKREEYMFVSLVLETFRKELLNEGLDISKLVFIDMSLGMYSSTFFSLEVFKDVELPIQHGLPASSACHKLMVNYFRVANGSFAMRDGILSIVRNLENIELDANPMLIYRALFNQDVLVDKALENERVRETVQTRLMVIRGVVTSVLDFLESNVESVSYILRYFFKLYGSGTFYSEFVMPFILAPDAFIESFVVSKALRNKCFIVSKVLGYVTDGVTVFEESDYGDEGIKDEEIGICVGNVENEKRSFELRFYSPLYPFFKNCRERYGEILRRLVNVSSLDNYFQFESMNDIGRVKKATVYLPSSTANQLTTLLMSNTNLLDTEMCEVLDALPLFPDDKNKTLSFMIFGPEWLCSQDSEKMALDNFIRGLKKKLIYAISVCKGRNLVEMLVKESDEEEQNAYTELRRNERAVKNDGEPMGVYPLVQYETVEHLKESIIDDLNFLENRRITARHNLYSEMLFMLAQDIVVLRFMSDERSKELRINELSYDNLCYRDDYLSNKIELYQNYLESFVTKLAIKKRPFFAFSNSTDEMVRDSKYGTYKYSAERLMSMGVLVQMYECLDVSEIFLLFLSDSPLLLSVEVYVQNILVSHPVSFRFDDLLKLRKNGNTICDIAGICSFSVCRFIDLMNSKYVGCEG